jgi:hypothetical protein
MYFLQASEKDERFGEFYKSTFIFCMGCNIILVMKDMLWPAIKEKYEAFKRIKWDVKFHFWKKEFY